MIWQFDPHYNLDHFLIWGWVKYAHKSQGIIKSSDQWMADYGWLQATWQLIGGKSCSQYKCRLPQWWSVIPVPLCTVMHAVRGFKSRLGLDCGFVDVMIGGCDLMVRYVQITLAICWRWLSIWTGNAHPLNPQVFRKRHRNRCPLSRDSYLGSLKNLNLG